MGRGRIGHWPLLLAAAFGVAHFAEAGAAPEYQVKAAFLYKFATYIRWPPTGGAESGAPFVIGVLGRDPFGPSLGDVVRNQSVQGRGIRIRMLSRREEALECELVFISASERTDLAQLFALLRGAPVLTVGDMDQFAERGGMIGLVTTEDNHVRFDINTAAIERAGLRASSQLLHLGRIVEGAREEGGHH
jgi:hypothetical protein